MADEPAAPAPAPAAIGTTVTLKQLVYISYGLYELSSEEVILQINECVSHNQQIDLEIFFYDGCDATVAMVVENSRHIKEIRMYNYCIGKEEHDKCFNFVTKIVRQIIGDGKNLSYSSSDFEIELEQANQLAEALRRSNNNINCVIDSFHFHECYLTPLIVQPLLDALLDNGVRKIRFANDHTGEFPINYNNSTIDFTGIETNISLKELDLSIFDIREEDFRSLFHAIKKNKGLEKLQLNNWRFRYLPTRMKRLFEEMLCENITLRDCRLSDDEDEREDDPIFEMIQFHMKVNRMMKRYIVKSNAKSTIATMAVRAGAGAGADAGAGAGAGDGDGASTVEANNNKKKKLKMRMLLNLFIQKPVLRDTMIFHLLRDYPDDLMDPDFQFRMDVVPDRDADDRGTNDRDDDTHSDSYDATDDNDSDSNDGTDGIL